MSKIKRQTALVPLSDLTDDTAKQRRHRVRLLRSGIATSLVSRSAAVIAPVVMVPITLGYLGKEQYGLWMAVLALSSMALWADLGLGSGLMTSLARARGLRDMTLARRQVSTTYLLLGSLAIVLLCVLWGIGSLLPWGDILNVSDPTLNATAKHVALLCLSATALNIPLSLVNRVQYAFQQVSRSNLWQASGSLTSVALAWLCVGLESSPVLVIGAAVSGPAIANVVNSIFFYRRSMPEVSPSLRFAKKAIARALSRQGGQFFVISIFSSVALNADSFIIAHRLGLGAATDFAVPSRLVAALGMIVTLVNLPFWASSGEAINRGDVDWVKSTTRKMSLFSGLAIAVPSVVLVIFGDRLLSGWTGGTVHALPGLLVCLCIWWVLVATASPWFMVQNAIGDVRVQMMGWMLYAAVILPAKWLAAPNWGVTGVVALGIVGYMTIIWPSALAGYHVGIRNHNLRRSA